LFGLLVRFRRFLYAAGIARSYRAAIPVVSVGNLTVGGTGKTPVVDYLVKHELRAGRRVAVVSRGYGGRRKTGTALVSDGEGQLDDDAHLLGDEPVLLARRNPQAIVIVARRRSEGVRLAEALGAELAILDDGFQHLALERDLDILLLDAVRPFGNHRLLPAGVLREPVAALRRCDLVLLTRSQADTPIDLPVAKPLVRCRHILAGQLPGLDGRMLGWDDLRGRRVLGFAGIARPQDFFASLREHGIDLQAEVFLADHQEYGPETLKRLHQACHNCELMITTEKDAVKLHAADLPLPCCHVVLELELFDAAPLEAALANLNRRTDNATVC
jgi:tetraacyldisaccharide 4'-kinase